MADLITALLLMLGAGGAAEGVRTFCRRKLLTPLGGEGAVGAVRSSRAQSSP
jgi:hypothetical protein